VQPVVYEKLPGSMKVHELPPFLERRHAATSDDESGKNRHAAAANYGSTDTGCETRLSPPATANY
jgi:hypothetical protein